MLEVESGKRTDRPALATALRFAVQKLVAAYNLDRALHFSATRRHIRDMIIETAIGQELNSVVSDLIE